MTHHQGEATAIEWAEEVLSERALEGVAKILELVVNDTMKFKRAEVPGPLRTLFSAIARQAEEHAPDL